MGFSKEFAMKDGLRDARGSGLKCKKFHGRPETVEAAKRVRPSAPFLIRGEMRLLMAQQ
jgi:hypothetical protein